MVTAATGIVHFIIRPTVLHFSYKDKHNSYVTTFIIPLSFGGVAFKLFYPSELLEIVVSIFTNAQKGAVCRMGIFSFYFLISDCFEQPEVPFSLNLPHCLVRDLWILRGFIRRQLPAVNCHLCCLSPPVTKPHIQESSSCNIKYRNRQKQLRVFVLHTLICSCTAAYLLPMAIY